MWWYDYWPWPWIFVGPMMMFVFLAICAALVFFMMRGRERGGAGAVEILKERFARGEINQTEFEQRRRLVER